MKRPPGLFPGDRGLPCWLTESHLLMCPHVVEGTDASMIKALILFSRVPTRRLHYLFTALLPDINYVPRTSTLWGQEGHRCSLYHVLDNSSVVAYLSCSDCSSQ